MSLENMQDPEGYVDRLIDERDDARRALRELVRLVRVHLPYPARGLGNFLEGIEDNMEGWDK